MGRIALNPGSASVFHGDQDAARIGTVVRAGGMNRFLHDLCIIDLFANEKETGGHLSPPMSLRGQLTTPAHDALTSGALSYSDP